MVNQKGCQRDKCKGGIHFFDVQKCNGKQTNNQDARNQFGGFGEYILFDEIVQYFINKYTRKWCDKKEQPFFNGKIDKKHSCNIVVVEIPHAHACKPNVPGNK